MHNSHGLRSDNNVSSVFRVIDIAILVNGFFIVMLLRGLSLNDSYFFILTLTIAIFLYFSESFGIYRRLRMKNFTERATSIITVTSLSFLLSVFILFVLKEAESFSRIAVLGWYVLSLTALIGWRLAYRAFKVKMYRNGKNLKKVAIIGLSPSGKSLKKEILSSSDLGLEFIGFYDDREASRLNENSEKLQGTVRDALQLAQSGELDSVYICIPLSAEKRIAHIIRTLSDSTVDVFIVPDFLLNTIMHGNLGNLGKIDTISVFEQPINGTNEFYKRAFDISFSLLALIMLAPVLFIIAVLVKATSKGPVLFKQDRYGLDGRHIKVHKFRSMTVMENSNDVVQAKKGDARITKVGSFLRKTSLDELPQFWDVLMGRMSVVGPRPHAISHNEQYRKLVDFYMLRHKVKPGITGWAQINGWRGETDTLEKMEKRIEYDLQYIRNWSLWWDIKIIFLTIFKGFINKNAY